MDKIKKVLVIDDSKLARLTLSRLIIARSIYVVQADSVVEGLKALKKEQFDAIFLDVQMPDQDGFAGLKIFKANPQFKNIPVSMYSADSTDLAQKQAVERGAQAYLFKPANDENLDEVLKVLSDNVVAESMQQFTPRTADSVLETQANNIKKHQKVLMTLDERTRTLARVFNSDKKTADTTVKQVLKRIEKIETQAHSLKKRNESAQHEDLLQQRADNDMRGELKKIRDNQRLVMTVSIIATILSVSSIILGAIVYFK